MRPGKLFQALFLICAVIALPEYARADSIPAELFVATVTKVGTPTQPQWRIEVNNFPGYELTNVSLTFTFVGGSITYSFSDILAGKFVDTTSFDPSAQFVSLTLQYTWPNQTLKIGPFDTFTANSLVNSASENAFPPPLAVYLSGTDTHVVPEPGSFILLGTGMVSLLSLRRALKPS